ncbi:FMN-dependent NADH-azoreductase [Pseudoalteromonas viridis]|uniref:FMN dependent NADH:quinone oxidoreductase n=1 Tax=Pseudoalteromonas viridis TaxID=339617 RepID=A0ABX7VGB1_9GAMM|nr:NAD(P)H-dependent oxidoreductase [Pseudoalteromonas viridis]QTL37908.1 NAD(P)H-dependent oxidoreductase [Pseudoalteromonas viridis]
MKKQVLIIKSSPANEFSVSSEIADYLQAQLQNSNETQAFTIRDLSKTPAPVYDNQILNSFYGDQNALTAEQTEIAQPSLLYIDELKQADIIVFASPMHNFSVTSLMKNYIDQICRFGLTFSYSEQGPKGLLEGKQAVIIASAGADMSQPEMHSVDFQVPYLKQVLGFIGITNIDVITAYGISMPDIGSEVATEQAKAQVDQWIGAIV